MVKRIIIDYFVSHKDLLFFFFALSMLITFGLPLFLDFIDSLLLSHKDEAIKKTMSYDCYFLSGGYETFETDSSCCAIDYFKRVAANRNTVCTGIYCEGVLIADMQDLNDL